MKLGYIVPTCHDQKVRTNKTYKILDIDILDEKVAHVKKVENLLSVLTLKLVCIVCESVGLIKVASMP